MKTITIDQLNQIIAEHKRWLADNGGVRADLHGADLHGADLRETDLSGANLRETDLSGANLREADLSEADLRGADLRGADLSGANLHGADLSEANLRRTDLRRADLSEADLSRADLRWAKLSGADLSGAKTDRRYIQIGCIGSAKRMTTYCFDDNIIWCGCFKGTLDEFEKQVNIAHANNPQYLAEYIGFVEYLKRLKGE